MRRRITPILAYIGAGLMLAVTVCVPFVLIGAFSHAVARTGLHIDAAYTGGTVARTIAHEGYRVMIYKPVQPHALQRMDPFAQIAFTPASALPPRVLEDVDLEGRGQPDVRISFVVPSDPHARPSGQIVALNSHYQSFTMPGPYSFSQLIVHTGDTILVRVSIRPDR
jgi:hypothetical protein